MNIKARIISISAIGVFFLPMVILWSLFKNDPDVELACSPEPLLKEPEEPKQPERRQPEGFFSIDVLEEIYGPLPWKEEEENAIN